MTNARLLHIEVADWRRNLRTTKGEAMPLIVSLAPGEHVCIVGTSGCGKSTLLHRLADAAMAGKASADRLSTGLLLQEGVLLDHLTVRQNLELITRHAERQWSTGDAVANCVAALKLPVELLERRVSELSGGQLRRVAIARMLLLQPQVMLYDEPDAGLDLVSLMSLASLVNGLLSTSEGNQTAAMTVSHNPLYIARIATRVVELRDGELHTLFEWSVPPKSDAQSNQRMLDLMSTLSALTPAEPVSLALFPSGRESSMTPGVANFFKSLGRVLSGVFEGTRSRCDSLRVWLFGLQLAFLSGAVFFALVGLMLGATTMAVVKLLTDTALQGWIAWFVNPQDIVALMGGRYALYLGPAVGSMLFAARSGSLVANWLGELQRSRQLEALRYLQVPIYAYAVTPMLLATVMAAGLTIAWFTLAVWWGGVLGARELFDLDNAANLFAITSQDMVTSQLILKLALYSICLGWLIIAFAMQFKRTNREVNRDTTGAIVWSTIVVAMFELLIILS